MAQEYSAGVETQTESEIIFTCTDRSEKVHKIPLQRFKLLQLVPGAGSEAERIQRGEELIVSFMREQGPLDMLAVPNDYVAKVTVWARKKSRI